jgi:hypothetical protein
MWVIGECVILILVRITGNITSYDISRMNEETRSAYASRSKYTEAERLKALEAVEIRLGTHAAV